MRLHLIIIACLVVSCSALAWLAEPMPEQTQSAQRNPGMECVCTLPTPTESKQQRQPRDGVVDIVGAVGGLITGNPMTGVLIAQIGRAALHLLFRRRTSVASA